MLWSFLRLVRLFSLDIVIGACISSIYFTKLFGVQVNPVAVACLGMAIWLIYTMDHLVDGTRLGANGAQRHVLHRIYRRPIFAVWIAVALTGLIVSFQLPTEILTVGLILSLLVLVYFLFVHIVVTRLYYHKELLAAAIYTAGITTPALAEPAGPPEFIWLFMMEFFLLCLFNLLLFARMDLDYDRSQQFGSLPSSMGDQGFGQLLKVLGMSFLVLVVVGSIFLYPNFVLLQGQLVLVLMFMILVGLNRWSRGRSSSLQFQLVGDAIFVVPLIGLL